MKKQVKLFRVSTVFRCFNNAANRKIKEHFLFYRKCRLMKKIKQTTTMFESLHDEKICAG